MSTSTSPGDSPSSVHSSRDAGPAGNTSRFSGSVRAKVRFALKEGLLAVSNHRNADFASTSLGSSSRKAHARQILRVQIIPDHFSLPDENGLKRLSPINVESASSVHMRVITSEEGRTLRVTVPADESTTRRRRSSVEIGLFADLADEHSGWNWAEEDSSGTESEGTSADRSHRHHQVTRRRRPKSKSQRLEAWRATTAVAKHHRHSSNVIHHTRTASDTDSDCTEDDSDALPSRNPRLLRSSSVKGMARPSTRGRSVELKRNFTLGGVPASDEATTASRPSAPSVDNMDLQRLQFLPLLG